ncbi:hypothetical protein AK812_SmicGene22731 [Symbiodinium microadriaticum]|uniref:Uncharacterized protein n=1 Tax=Symbiodinium microadriaticum TaxID=2951 RepID=A0A1Q9DJ34_SYMMI|nr:hypothetical protein AK812_SmicGene22731 [Symbiodinium microadriaticum]
MKEESPGQLTFSLKLTMFKQLLISLRERLTDTHKDPAAMEHAKTLGWIDGDQNWKTLKWNPMHQNLEVDPSFRPATLSWPLPPRRFSTATEDCHLMRPAKELLLVTLVGNGSCPNALSNAAAQGCLVMGLACGSSYQARVAPVCSDIAAQPVDTGNATTFTMDRGAACHIRAGRPAGVVVLATSVSGVSAACHIRAGRPAGVVVLATSVSGVSAGTPQCFGTQVFQVL